MEIKEFVKTTLREICAAVDEIKAENPKLAIAPSSLSYEKGNKIESVTYTEPNTVEFELSLEVSKEGRVGIRVAEAKGEERQMHKVKFSIPVLFNATAGNKK